MTCPPKIAANWKARNDRPGPGLPGFPRTPQRSQEVAHPRAGRWHHWDGGLRRRISDVAFSVLPLLPVGLPLRCRPRRRLPGVADATVRHRRRVGCHHPPPLRSRGAHTAPRRPDVPAHPDRHSQPLRLVASSQSVSRRGTPPQAALSQRPLLPDPHRRLFRGLVVPRLVSEPLLRPRRLRGPPCRAWQDERHLRPGPDLLGPERYLHVHRLGALAPSRMVLHHVRSTLHGEPGAHFDGLPDRLDGAALLPPPHVGDPHPASPEIG